MSLETRLAAFADRVADEINAVRSALTSGLSGKVGTGDSRLTDSRTPTAHKSTHATGGGDALSAADIGALGATATAGGVLTGNYPNPGLSLVPNAPFTLTYAGTLTPNAANGNFQRCALTGGPTLAEPSNGADGQELLLEFSAASSQTVTLFSRRLSNVAATLVIGSGHFGHVRMIYRSGAGWIIMAADKTG